MDGEDVRWGDKKDLEKRTYILDRCYFLTSPLLNSFDGSSGFDKSPPLMSEENEVSSTGIRVPKCRRSP